MTARSAAGSVAADDRHVFLVHPSANRVYAAAAPELARAELDALNALTLGGRLASAEVIELGGRPYVAVDGEMGDDGVAVVSNHSGVYALFSRDGDALRPVPLRRLDRWPDDLVTIQRYQGKTNEQLTRLLVNLAAAAAGGAAPFTGDRSMRFLDPLSGRGSTLNQVVLYGWDASGVEVDRQDVDAYRTFFTTWLKDKRVKHKAQQRGTRWTVTVAASQEVVVECADSAAGVSRLGKRFADAVVADLPYGVRHGSRSGAGLRRRPDELLDEALPEWVAALRPGGAMALAWNTKVLARDDLVARLVGAGLHPADGVSPDGFVHRLDHAVVRDVVVMRR